MSPTTLTQALVLVRELSTQEKLYLLHELTTQLLQQSATPSDSHVPMALPVIHLKKWPDDIPIRREDLYNDRER